MKSLIWTAISPSKRSDESLYDDVVFTISVMGTSESGDEPARMRRRGGAMITIGVVLTMTTTTVIYSLWFARGGCIVDQVQIVEGPV